MRILRYLNILCCILIATSCRETIPETYSDFKSLPVVNAILIEGDTLSINISLADQLGDKSLEYIENASVELFINDQFVEDLSYSDEGNYISTTLIKSGDKYRCEVLVPGYDTVYCEQIVPDKPKIVEIIHINVAGKDEEDISFPAIKLSFENKVLSRSYYEVEIFHLDNYRNEKTKANLKTITDPVLLNEGIPLALFSNELIKDSIYTLHLNYWTNTYSGSKTNIYPFVVEFRQVSEDYYRYLKQLYLYENGLWADGILTSMTNNNIYSNVENGYGIFAACAVAVSDTITPNLDDYYE
ncbi:DUF4249 domain-containing protein [Roseimarinus sediminis]|uniref:DUF4249 domain-containing protein n=1 Tax=Roseimarinus sediminis TaxID=1610899 RepID=UPI003D1BB97B